MRVILPQIVLSTLSLIFNIVPNFILVVMCEGITIFWFYVVRFRKKLVLDNLRHAFAQELSESEIQKLAYKNFRHYVYFGVEYVQLTFMSEKRFLKSIKIINKEDLVAALAKKKGVILLATHSGNFEWAAHGISMNIQTFNIVARPMKNEGVNQWLLKQRKKWKTKEFLPKNISWTMYRMLKEGKLMGFVIDQRKSPPDGIYVDFFNRKAATTKGLAYIAERTGALVIPLFMHRESFGKNVVEFLKPIIYKRVGTRKENIYHNTQVYSSVSEAMIRKYPDQWFWIHKRWKGSPEAEKTVTTLYEIPTLS